MFAHITTISGGNADTTTKNLDSTARHQIETTKGNCGFAVCSNNDEALAVSYWDTEESLTSSERSLSTSSQSSADAGGGHLTIESYEVVASTQISTPTPNSLVRRTTVHIDPSRIDNAISFFQNSTMPELSGSQGLSSMQLLIDRSAGTGIILGTWSNASAAENASSSIEKDRSRASDKAGIEVTQEDDFSLTSSTAQLG